METGINSADIRKGKMSAKVSKGLAAQYLETPKADLYVDDKAGMTLKLYPKCSRYVQKEVRY